MRGFLDFSGGAPCDWKEEDVGIREDIKAQHRTAHVNNSKRIEKLIGGGLLGYL